MRDTSCNQASESISEIGVRTFGRSNVQTFEHLNVRTFECSYKVDRFKWLKSFSVPGQGFRHKSSRLPLRQGSLPKNKPTSGNNFWRRICYRGLKNPRSSKTPVSWKKINAKIFHPNTKWLKSFSVPGQGKKHILSLLPLQQGSLPKNKGTSGNNFLRRSCHRGLKTCSSSPTSLFSKKTTLKIFAPNLPKSENGRKIARIAPIWTIFSRNRARRSDLDFKKSDVLDVFERFGRFRTFSSVFGRFRTFSNVLERFGTFSDVFS